MKDYELRALVLQYFYNKRRDGFISAPQPNFIGNVINESAIMDIIDQLSHAGLIEWYSQRKNGHYMFVDKGKITGKGVDVIEGLLVPPIAIAITYQQNITVNQASDFQIGDNNNLNKHQ